MFWHKQSQKASKGYSFKPSSTIDQSVMLALAKQIDKQRQNSQKELELTPAPTNDEREADVCSELSS